MNTENAAANASTTNTSSIDWQTLADVVAEGKCVLFLGPEATVNYSDKKKQMSFFSQLLDENPNEIHSYHQEDGLFVFSKKEAIYNVSVKVRNFYQNDYSSPMLAKLAQIPFHFIVSLAMDTSLQKEMKRQGFLFNEDYYSELNEHTPELPSSKTFPLIYHLLGTANDTDTIIVSHGMMYNYIRSFLGGTKIPQNIKTALNFQNAKTLIFLGLNFDKWYFQLILNMIGVDASSYHCFSSIQGGATGLRTIWEKHFRIHFVPHEIDEFVEKLHKIFADKNQLREAAHSTPVQRQYKNSNLVKFFNVALSGTDFETFCLSYFDEVHNDFTPDQGKSARINKLLEHVQHHDQYDRLLKLMKEENPVQFLKNEPYYE